MDAPASKDARGCSMNKSLLVALCVTVLVLSALLFLKTSHEITPHELKQKYAKFKEEYAKKKSQGYDLGEATWWLKEARKEYFEGNYEKANEYLDKAILALEGAERIDFSVPEVPESGWNITEEPNTLIEKIPTIKDWVPIGITYNLEENNLLRYIPGYPWQQSCFIFVAIGKSREGDTLFYQGRLPFEGGFAPRINVNGEYLRSVPVFRGGMYYYEDGTEGYPYPTVVVYGTKGYKEILAYDEENQTWYHEIIPPDENGLKIKIRAKALGTPFWMGPQEGPYIVHGAFSGTKDIDAWGGFWVVGRFEGKVKLPYKEEKEFSGYFLFDRATHIAYYAQQEYQGEYCREALCPARGGVVEFSCLAIFHENFTITLCDSTNPTPVNFPKFQHQGRINYIFNESYPFNHFILKSFGEKLQPSGFELKGNFENGSVNLTGTAIEYWPPKGWGRVEGTWWDPEGKRTWGRAFISWKGELKFRGETIKVEDAIGIGEFTRFEKG